MSGILVRIMVGMLVGNMVGMYASNVDRIMPAPKMIDNSQAGGADRLNTVKYHTLKLNKYWKGLGKRERYKIEAAAAGPLANANVGSLADARYFLSFRCTAPVQFLGVTICKFCADAGLARQVVFDRLAPQAQ